MGGVPPYGYRVENRKLVVDEKRHACALDLRPLPSSSGPAQNGARVGTADPTPRGNRIDKKYIYRARKPRRTIAESGAIKGEQLVPASKRHHRFRDLGQRLHVILQEPQETRRRRYTRRLRPRWLKGLFVPRAAFSPTYPKGDSSTGYYVTSSVSRCRVSPVVACPGDRRRVSTNFGPYFASRRFRRDMEGGTRSTPTASPNPTPARPAAARSAVGRTVPRRASTHRDIAG